MCQPSHSQSETASLNWLGSARSPPARKTFTKFKNEKPNYTQGLGSISSTTQNESFEEKLLNNYENYHRPKEEY